MRSSSLRIAATAISLALCGLSAAAPPAKAREVCLARINGEIKAVPCWPPFPIDQRTQYCQMDPNGGRVCVPFQGPALRE